MRILIVSTSERKGGAAVAASRLVEALNNNGMRAQMLVRDKQTDAITVASVRPRWLMRWRFLYERWRIFCRLGFTRHNLFRIDTGQCGANITRTMEFRQADIIHLHWVSQGMLSLKDIRRIVKSGKPVVWTMHDIWPATGICHLSLGCARFKTGCHHCPLLPGGGGDNDLAARVWRRKREVVRNSHIHFVACSEWLASEARKSALLRDQTVSTIPNPIDTRIYSPQDQAAARRRLGLPEDKRIILFAAQRTDNRNKGLDYLYEAISLMVEQQPDAPLALAVMGAAKEQMGRELPVPVYLLGYLADHDSLVDAYNAADVFVLPSLSENLPNTIMEAMACGVPCVGFRVGGIPEMIDHQKNGYVARYRDSHDLAEGIRWTLFEADRQQMGREARQKVHACYSQTTVALQYEDVYRQLLTYKQLSL